MAQAKIPYVTAYGNVTKALQKIQPAATPDRFTHDFLSTKLQMTGGSARPVIPFFKRIGFLASDGAPTDRYTRFRTSSTRGAAAAEALKEGYAPLYELNEYAHDLDDDEVRDLVIQLTGSEEGSSTVGAIVGSFRALQSFAKFDGATEDDSGGGGADQQSDGNGNGGADEGSDGHVELPPGLSVGYTINLHLPATSDVAVFNAIFKSLRENLLR